MIDYIWVYSPYQIVLVKSPPPNLKLVPSPVKSRGTGVSSLWIISLIYSSGGRVVLVTVRWIRRLLTAELYTSVYKVSKTKLLFLAAEVWS